MAEFLSKLKTDGVFKNYKGKPLGEILDVDGNPVKGKHLSDFVFFTHDEQFAIDYYKSEAKKEALRRLYKETALKKIQLRLETARFVPRDKQRSAQEHFYRSQSAKAVRQRRDGQKGVRGRSEANGYQTDSVINENRRHRFVRHTFTMRRTLQNSDSKKFVKYDLTNS